MLKSSLCDYCVGYTLVKGTIAVSNRASQVQMQIIPIKI